MLSCLWQSTQACILCIGMTSHIANVSKSMHRGMMYMGQIRIHCMQLRSQHPLRAMRSSAAFSLTTVLVRLLIWSARSCTARAWYTCCRTASPSVTFSGTLSRLPLSGASPHFAPTCSAAAFDTACAYDSNIHDTTSALQEQFMAICGDRQCASPWSKAQDVSCVHA